MNSSRAGTEAAPGAIVTVESLNHDGRGVARRDGKVVFVDGALPGEEVRLRVRRHHRRYDDATAVEVLHPSPERQSPRCAHFGVCGGCSLQHLEGTAQLRAKQDILAEQLKRIGKTAPGEWLAPLTGAAWNYRRRARLGVRHVEAKGGTLVGFRERRSSYVANLDSCPVLDATVSDWLPALRALVSTMSCHDRIPQIEVAVGDNARALVFRNLATLSADDANALREFGRVHAAQIFLQPGTPDKLQALWPDEPQELYYDLPEGIRIRFRPTDFVQVNASVNGPMVQRALQLLDVQADDGVLDLFAGLGNFTLPLARRAARVLGIEGESGLVERARDNAARNGITNAEFRVANLYDEKTPVPWQGFAFDKLLLDPPRTGAIEVIRRLHDSAPRRLVYVSCYPATLARDAQYLVHVLGYRLSAAGVMDMFPHTAHVESITLFEKP